MEVNIYAVAALALTLLTHTAGLFYYGGKISQSVVNMDKILKDHEQRLRDLEHIHPGTKMRQGHDN